jgi:hypothetical protein
VGEHGFELDPTDRKGIEFNHSNRALGVCRRPGSSSLMKLRLNYLLRLTLLLEMLLDHFGGILRWVLGAA